MARALDRHEQLAVIADPRRLGILRMLMARPATLSQIGERLGKHPAWVRHHVQVLLAAGLIRLVEERTVRNYTEKYYGASADAFESHLLIAPESTSPTTLVALGSHDPALEMLGHDVERSRVGLVSVPIGSLDGLIALRQGLCDVAGCHLFDDERNEYNAPFLRHLFPDIPVLAVTLAYREQGLITAPGNPRGIRDFADLTDGTLRFANRNPGSGTRVWVDSHLRHTQLDPSAIAGYDTSFGTHTAVAKAVADGSADAGVGLRASAEALGLAFQPLFVERYDLVMRRDRVGDDDVHALLDSLSSRRFRRAMGGLAGYDTAHTGHEAVSA
jgi:putative molybdopterin biosynthesis protein